MRKNYKLVRKGGKLYYVFKESGLCWDFFDEYPNIGTVVNFGNIENAIEVNEDFLPWR